jgi:hypothetical protein
MPDEPTIYWRSAYPGAEWPLYASFEPVGAVFATVSRVEVPAPGWVATIRHRGWARRLEARCATVDRAQRYIERWARAHHADVLRALAADDDAPR